ADKVPPSRLSWFVRRRWRSRCSSRGLLANFGPACAMGIEVSVLIDNHDRLGAGRNVQVQSLLDFGHAGQLDAAIGCSIDCVLGTADSVRWRTAVRIWPIPHHADVSFRDGFLQSLVFTFTQINR